MSDDLRLHGLIGGAGGGVAALGDKQNILIGEDAVSGDRLHAVPQLGVYVTLSQIKVNIDTDNWCLSVMENGRKIVFIADTARYNVIGIRIIAYELLGDERLEYIGAATRAAHNYNTYASIIDTKKGKFLYTSRGADSTEVQGTWGGIYEDDDGFLRLSITGSSTLITPGGSLSRVGARYIGRMNGYDLVMVSCHYNGTTFYKIGRVNASNPVSITWVTGNKVLLNSDSDVGFGLIETAIVDDTHLALFGLYSGSPYGMCQFVEFNPVDMSHNDLNSLRFDTTSYNSSILVKAVAFPNEQKMWLLYGYSSSYFYIHEFGYSNWTPTYGGSTIWRPGYNTLRSYGPIRPAIDTVADWFDYDFIVPVWANYDHYGQQTDEGYTPGRPHGYLAFSFDANGLSKSKIMMAPVSQNMVSSYWRICSDMVARTFKNSESFYIIHETLDLVAPFMGKKRLQVKKKDLFKRYWFPNSIAEVVYSYSTVKMYGLVFKDYLVINSAEISTTDDTLFVIYDLRSGEPVLELVMDNDDGTYNNTTSLMRVIFDDTTYLYVMYQVYSGFKVLRYEKETGDMVDDYVSPMSTAVSGLVGTHFRDTFIAMASTTRIQVYNMADFSVDNLTIGTTANPVGIEPITTDKFIVPQSDGDVSIYQWNGTTITSLSNLNIPEAATGKYLSTKQTWYANDILNIIGFIDTSNFEIIKVLVDDVTNFVSFVSKVTVSLPYAIANDDMLFVEHDTYIECHGATTGGENFNFKLDKTTLEIYDEFLFWGRDSTGTEGNYSIMCPEHNGKYYTLRANDAYNRFLLQLYPSHDSTVVTEDVIAGTEVEVRI